MSRVIALQQPQNVTVQTYTRFQEHSRAAEATGDEDAAAMEERRETRMIKEKEAKLAEEKLGCR